MLIWLFAQCTVVNDAATVYLSSINAFFACRNCLRVAGIPIVSYSFTFDSTESPSHVVSTERFPLIFDCCRRRALNSTVSYCEAVPGRGDVIFILYMLCPRVSCVVRRITRLLQLHFTTPTKWTHSHSRAGPRVALLSVFACIVLPPSPIVAG